MADESTATAPTAPIGDRQPFAPNSPGVNSPTISDARRDLSLWFRVPVVVTFAWVFFGICGIFGYRLWWNSPAHPSFVPFAVAAFASVVAYSIVRSLDIAAGSPITLKIAGQEFTGASGPVILWIGSFMVIVYGFSLLNVFQLATSTAPTAPPVHTLSNNMMPH